MIYTLLAIGGLLYCFQAFVSYSPTAKASAWFFPLGCVLAALCAACWYGIARVTEGTTTYKLGAFWDVMVAAAFLIVPILAWGIRPSVWGWAGLSLMLLGAWLISLK